MTATISTKVPVQLRRKISEIAELEKRSVSKVVHLAIEFYVNSYFELHPQFKADIMESRAAIASGDVEDYEFE